MNLSTHFTGTEKRVPLVLAQSIGALASVQFQITPQFDFRGEYLIVDPAIAASCTVQPPTVGPNVQVAGGSNTGAVSGQMFAPTQTDAMRWGMDIANQGNQLTLTVTSLLTSTSLAFGAYIMGTVVAAGGVGARAGIAPAAMYRAGIAPATGYRAGIAPHGHYQR